MKKLICMLLSIVLIFSSLSVFAISDNDNEELKSVLLVVKSRIPVSDEFTEFDMSIRGNNTETQQKKYEYCWDTKDGGKSLFVSADKSGHIISYSLYIGKDESIRSDLSVKYDICRKVADDFIKTALPECFEDPDDCYVIEDTDSKTGTLSRNTVSFDFSYKRIKDGYPVEGNNGSVHIILDGSTPVVSGMDSSWEYESKFYKVEKILDNPVEAYLKLFPLEMVYKNKYVPYRYAMNEDNDTPVLVYRFKDNQTGYILADSGEKFEPKKSNMLFNSAMKEEVSQDSAAGGALKGELTPEEISRIDEISGLISSEAAEKLIRDNKHLSIEDIYTRNSSSLYKPKRDDDDYIRTISLSFSTEKESGDIHASLDARSGDIMSYSRSVYGPDVWNKEYIATEEEKALAYEKLEAFLKDTAKAYIDEYRVKDNNSYNSSVSRTYERYIDDVRYINNTINVSYDLRQDFITGYNISYTKKFTDLPSVKDAIGMDKAKSIIFDLYPVTLSYMRGEDGYYLCYGNRSNRSAEIYAVSGDKISESTRTPNLIPYSDINNHWVKDAADQLLNVGIGFDDGILNPDEKCSQVDFFRIMLCAVYKSTYYLTYTDDDIYSRIEDEQYIQSDEKNPSGNVKREDAFVYTVRIMNHEEIAKLKDIFKTDFADNSDIDEDKIGYAAILKGFELISGDGTYLRPKEDITRAEVISMAYNCIIKR